MARITGISDAHILDAAREVFLAEGFEASTVEIARRAGVSHGALFKHFPTKDELFQAALDFPPDPEWVAGLATRAGQGDIQESLELLVQQIIIALVEIMPRIVALRARGYSLMAPHLTSPDSPPARFVRLFTAYLQEEMRLGRARGCDPEILAHALLGPATNYVMLGVLGPPGLTRPGPAEFAAQLVDVMWQGMAPSLELPA